MGDVRAPGRANVLTCIKAGPAARAKLRSGIAVRNSSRTEKRAMSGTEREVEKKKRDYEAEKKRREAMKQTSSASPAKHEKRVDHYVEKEKAELKEEAKSAQTNKALREG